MTPPQAYQTTNQPFHQPHCFPTCSTSFFFSSLFFFFPYLVLTKSLQTCDSQGSKSPHFDARLADSQGVG
ncbi:hypothetical protein VIGAN_01115800 [Vigna angularis var. angularis]|uniref:Uncharacterized protein n=1 Tax=Vigna angularis var. angularis TaxID=157739 RepID=A0A0S3QZ72_PHAAN|nr:hypothetical protein VIGAN_01115800 [Vigna angularis var. angularis]